MAMSPALEQTDLRQRRAEAAPTAAERAAELERMAADNAAFEARTAVQLAASDRRLNYLAAGGIVMCTVAILNHLFNPGEVKAKNEITTTLAIIGLSTLLTSIIMPRDLFGLQNFDASGRIIYDIMGAEHQRLLRQEAAGHQPAQLAFGTPTPPSDLASAASIEGSGQRT